MRSPGFRPFSRVLQRLLMDGERRRSEFALKRSDLRWGADLQSHVRDAGKILQ
jgi:hypothetical protein